MVDITPQSQSTESQFRASMGLVSNLSLGFTYLSPLGGLAAILPFALITAGAPSIWWLVLVALGQLTVALVFGEIVSQYPITGGVYPWARRLWGRRYAWMTGWVYLCALVVNIASVAHFAVPYAAHLLGVESTRGVTLGLALGISALALVANLSGTRTLGRIAKLGFFAEIAGVVAYGLYLLVFERANSFGVLFDGMGAGGGSYFSAFVTASLVGLLLFFGFEACGDVAEEVDDPSRRIPVAMILTIVFGFISAFLAFLGFILAAPNLQEIVSGRVADPVTSILDATVGSTGTTIFNLIAVTALFSCCLSLQAALSRLVYSFARDRMLPGSQALGTLAGGGVPRNAMLLACIAPMVICFWVYLQPESLNRVVAFSVLGIYVCFQMVVLAALRQRARGWRPAGPFSLGQAGLAVNVVALLFGVASMIMLARPADASVPFLDRYIVLIGMAIVLVSGGLYMVAARPWEHSDAPESDAIEIADEIRAGADPVVVARRGLAQ